MRREQEKLPVVPVIVRPCPWKRIPWLAEMQVRPKRGVPLSAGKRHEFEAALARIAEEVDQLIELQKARRAVAPAAVDEAMSADSPASPLVGAPSGPPAPPLSLRSQVPSVVVPPAPVTRTPPAPAIHAPPGVTLRPFSFETVTLDERGQERERRKLTAHSYLEDLGGGVTLEVVAILGGTFTMGSPLDEADRRNTEGPQHGVTVAPFFTSRYPVTQAQWRAVAAWPCVMRDLDAAPSRFEGARRPVEQISWHDAVGFCARVERKTGRPYRLPSEAEWQYAARAGTRAPFAFGETITADVVNHDGRYPYRSASKGAYLGQTTDMDLFQFANAFGLHDVHGNVWEYTQDEWHDNYEGAPADGSARETCGDENRRVLRGGSWLNGARHCRSAVRSRYAPEDSNDTVGFRVVCAVSRTQS